MKKLLVLFGLIFAIFACSNDCMNVDVPQKNNNENNQGNTDEPEKRFTTLQDVVDNANAGEEIDLSDYELTSYTATVNKTLTIKNGSLSSAKLTVTAENVKLEKLADLSVTSSSRLTINDSKLSSLLIGGNGETSRSTTSDLETSLAMVSVTGCEIADIQLKGFNSQLNITDTATKIDDIVTSTKSKIILEAGSYDGMKDPTVTDDGELTRIDMTKDKELSVLSIYSNPKKAEYKLNEEIDLTGLIVMGTYTASVEIFKSGGWKGEAIESVTKWEDEKDYTVVDYDFSTAGIKIVTIKSKSADVECNFYVYVVDDSQNDETSKPEKEEIKVTDIRVKTLGTPKTSYKVGEKLDLSCYQVVGKYNGFEINLPYTSEPANGTVLTAENTQITFYYNGESVETKEITVRRPCTVEFYDGIGSSELVCKTEVAFGESLKLPVAPSKTGYTFDVWVDDVKNEVTSEKNVEEDLKLYATWTANTYTVKFDSNGGIGTMDSPTFTYDVAKELTANTFSRTGYIFAGWATSKDGNVVYADKESVKNLKSENNATITLYAQWTANTYTVKFNANGGSGTMADMSFNYDEPQTLTANTFTRTGYTFAGWATSKDGNVVYANKESVKNLKSENNATITLYAQWTANTYTVKFNANGGSGTMTDKTFTYDKEEPLTANSFTRTGYTFAGWNTQPDGKGTSYADEKKVSNLTTQADGKVILYAVWTANTYTVIFNTNGGNGNMDDMSFTYDEPQTLTTNDFTRDGYTFAGWATTANGGVTYTDERKVSNLTAKNNATVTLYAVWEENPTYIGGGIEIEGNKEVTFLLNEEASTGTITISQSQSVTISVKSGNTPLALTNAPTITVYNHGDVASSTSSLTQSSEGTYSFTIPETFPKDETYQFVVSCNYESITYTDTFTVKLSQ